jgi:hypothetical protein
MFHRVLDIPLKFRAMSDWLDGYEKDDGVVCPIKKRLYRWGEPHTK